MRFRAVLGLASRSMLLAGPKHGRLSVFAEGTVVVSSSGQHNEYSRNELLT